MPIKIKTQPKESPPRAQHVQDIFKILGDKAAREFISTRVHALPANLASIDVPGYLWSLHYGHHKDLENYAMVALERFNHA